MENLRIRKAGLADLDLLLQWRMEVLSHVFHLLDGPSRDLLEANRRYYQKALADGSHFALFGEIKGVPVGCGGLCLYQEMPSPDNSSGRCAYLMNIYTREEYGRQGIGRKIICSLLEEAKRQRAGKIYLETTEQARPLYTSLGFSEMTGCLILPLWEHSHLTGCRQE